MVFSYDSVEKLPLIILTSPSAFILWKYNKNSIYTEDDEEGDGDDEEMEDDGNVEGKVNMLRFLLLLFNCFVLFCSVLSTFFSFCVKAPNGTKPFSEELLKRIQNFVALK